MLNHAVIVVSLFFSAVLPVHAENKSNPAKSLQGTWDVVSLTVNGKDVPADELKGLQVVLTKTTMALTSPDKDKRREFTLRVDAAKKPAHFDTVALDGPFKGQTNPGIYQLDGDDLKLCVPNDKTDQRPKEFSSPEGKKLVLLLLKRAKK